MRRAVEILVAFTKLTGHDHPHLNVTLGNYGRLLGEMGHNPEQVAAALLVLKENSAD